MHFKPQTEEELKAARLLPEGEYPFEVLEASERDKDGGPLKSKKGNDMLKVKLNVFGRDSTQHVYDYLGEFMAFKLRHFCYSVGLGKAYDAGTITAQQCVGKQGYVEIEVEPKGDYGPKNKVTDYVVKEESTAAPATKEDDVPF